MKIFPRLLFLCLGVFLCASTAQAKRKHRSSDPSPAPLATPAAEPPALPSETAPKIAPEAPPSLSLQPFVDAHLGNLLAPLGQPAFAQPELIASLKASYADGMASAPDTHKAAYQFAQSVCEAMNGAMAERQNAVTALRGALATRSSEAEQPRGGGEAVARARDEDNFFVDSQKSAWIERSNVLRQNITTLYLRERTVERQIGAWSLPTPPAYIVGNTATAANSPQAPAAPLPSIAVQPHQENRTFEQQVTGSTWEFPWGGRTSSIELKPGGELMLGWHKSAKGFKWRVQTDGVIEVYAYMDGHRFDTMRIPSNRLSATLTRGDQQIGIIRRLN